MPRTVSAAILKPNSEARRFGELGSWSKELELAEWPGQLSGRAAAKPGTAAGSGPGIRRPAAASLRPRRGRARVDR
eukprot:703465-Hanusia_phi.AAC.1